MNSQIGSIEYETCVHIVLVGFIHFDFFAIVYEDSKKKILSPL